MLHTCTFILYVNYHVKDMWVDKCTFILIDFVAKGEFTLVSRDDVMCVYLCLCAYMRDCVYLLYNC